MSKTEPRWLGVGGAGQELKSIPTTVGGTDDICPQMSQTHWENPVEIWGNEEPIPLKSWCLSYLPATVWWLLAMASSRVVIIPPSSDAPRELLFSCSASCLPPLRSLSHVSSSLLPFYFLFHFTFKIDCIFRSSLGSLSRSCHFPYTHVTSPCIDMPQGCFEELSSLPQKFIPSSL